MKPMVPHEIVEEIIAERDRYREALEAVLEAHGIISALRIARVALAASEGK